jgi:hypothetical protein
VPTLGKEEGRRRHRGDRRGGDYDSSRGEERRDGWRRRAERWEEDESRRGSGGRDAAVEGLGGGIYIFAIITIWH